VVVVSPFCGGTALRDAENSRDTGFRPARFRLLTLQAARPLARTRDDCLLVLTRLLAHAQL
jgi:hypothetical protein